MVYRGTREVCSLSGNRVPTGYKECPVCGKHLKAQGFGGHMHGVHNVRIGEKAQLADLQQRMEKYDNVLSRFLFWKSEVVCGQRGYQFLVVRVGGDEEEGEKK